MPLPQNGTPWPPKPLEAITPKLEEWSAWYAGDPAGLRTVYQRDVARPSVRPSQLRGGVVGAVARFWWGRPNGDLAAQRGQLHVPVAADLCQASADLLFSEPPTLTLVDQRSSGTQDRLDVLMEAAFTVLAEASEIGAALGGVYVRVTWDRDVVSDGPFLTAVHADAAWPEFRWGRLVAVTFHRVVHVDGQRILRHLERHELDSLGQGVILHGLYEGTLDNLGRVVPLTDMKATAPLADLVDADGLISTQTLGLAVVYVRNQGPQRRWRSDPVGAHLGRSDLDGVEGPMDALDETYSSWMRDLRLAKARILVPEFMLTHLGPGRGALWDDEQEVYSGLNVSPADVGTRDQIVPQQFAIRVEEHARTAQELTEVILRSAGYSASTFGEGQDGAAITATEVQSKQQRSFMTRDRKIRQWKPALGQVAGKLLAVDRVVFGNTASVVDSGVEVQFADAVQADPEALARTVETLHRAQAASTVTKVALFHPEWDGERVQAEADAITAQNAVADPLLALPPGA